jgi:TolB-like protein
LLYSFEKFLLDTETRELRRDRELQSVEPRVFDLLSYLIVNRERVVSKDDLVAGVWNGRIVSDAAMTTCLNSARIAIADSGEEQRLIKTLPRKGFRFVGAVQQANRPSDNVAGSERPLESTTPALALPDKPSIAVLPFENMSGDPEQEYFADGIVEDIINALSRFKSLFVIARHSSFTYKGKAVDIKQVGRELGVRYVLEGSVRKAGGRLRITGQMIEAATGAHIWAEKLDGPIEDIFDLQDSVTERVVGAMAPRITSAEIERARTKRPDSLDSYDHLLRATSLALPRSVDGLRTAIEHLEKAIGLAPSYSLAHGLIAECYGALHMLGFIRSDESERGLFHARRAIELDRDNPEVLTWAAYALSAFDSVAGSIALTERALALNPNLARAWVIDGMSRLYLAQHDEALAKLERSLRLNPIDPRIRRRWVELRLCIFFRGNMPMHSGGPKGACLRTPPTCTVFAQWQ